MIPFLWAILLLAEPQIVLLHLGNKNLFKTEVADTQWLVPSAHLLINILLEKKIASPVIGRRPCTNLFALAYPVTTVLNRPKWYGFDST